MYTLTNTVNVDLMCLLVLYSGQLMYTCIHAYQFRTNANMLLVSNPKSRLAYIKIRAT